MNKSKKLLSYVVDQVVEENEKPLIETEKSRKELPIHVVKTPG